MDGSWVSPPLRYTAQSSFTPAPSSSTASQRQQQHSRPIQPPTPVPYTQQPQQAPAMPSPPPPPPPSLPAPSLATAARWVAASWPPSRPPSRPPSTTITRGPDRCSRGPDLLTPLLTTCLSREHFQSRLTPTIPSSPTRGAASATSASAAATSSNAAAADPSNHPGLSLWRLVMAASRRATTLRSTDRQACGPGWQQRLRSCRQLPEGIAMMRPLPSVAATIANAAAAASTQTSPKMRRRGVLWRRPWIVWSCHYRVRRLSSWWRMMMMRRRVMVVWRVHCLRWRRRASRAPTRCCTRGASSVGGGGDGCGEEGEEVEAADTTAAAEQSVSERAASRDGLRC